MDQSVVTRSSREAKERTAVSMFFFLPRTERDAARAGSSSGEGECRSAAGGEDEKVQLYPPLEIRLVFQTAEAATQEAACSEGSSQRKTQGGSVAGPSR